MRNMKPVSRAAAEAAHLTMESLALPQELYWNGKVEPTSPLSSEPFINSELAGFWLHDDNFADDISIKDDTFEIKPGMELSDDLLSGEEFVVEFYDFKKEWSDDKLPLLEVGSAISHPNPITKVSNVFDIGSLEPGSPESAILTTLTPPQSPPQTVASPVTLQSLLPTEGVVNFNDALHAPLTTPLAAASALPLTHASASSSTASTPAITAAPVQVPLQNFGFAAYCGSAPGISIAVETQLSQSEIIPDDDDARNLQIVDEFLRSRVNELPNLSEDCESLSSYSSPSRAESITDEEWYPDSSASSSASSSPMHVGDAEVMRDTQTTSATKKRTRPYGRGIEDRKIRKKEQNKNAATRYRQKKKLEMETVLTEEQQLRQRNDELKRTLIERKREAKYLRTLIREFYKKK